MLSTIAACGTLKKEIGLRRDSEAFLLWPFSIILTYKTGALEIISGQLKEDLPGLMGFGVSSLKNMRIFYEAWSIEVSKSPTAVGDLQNTENERHHRNQLLSAG